LTDIAYCNILLSMSEEHPAPATATDSDPRLAVALARAEWRLEMLQELAGMGVSLAREINQRFVEGPHRPEPRPDPSRAYATVSRAVRLTLILEARTEKQILAWRKSDLSSLRALEPEPFLAPWFDSPAKRRERVRDCVARPSTARPSIRTRRSGCEHASSASLSNRSTSTTAVSRAASRPASRRSAATSG
jgi:hypothetical protein